MSDTPSALTTVCQTDMVVGLSVSLAGTAASAT
jgi:hypothetical protein